MPPVLLHDSVLVERRALAAYSTHRDHSFQRIVITRSRHRDRSDHGVIGAQRR